MKIPAEAIRITTEPAAEPVTLAEAKTHLRLDHDADDSQITSYIVAARIHCEDVSRRAFVTRTLTAELDCWPSDSVLKLPYPPLIAVSSIKYTDIDGVEATFASSNYWVDTHREPGRIALRRNASWPGVELREIAGIEIVWTAGYGDAEDVPETYKAAIKLVLADLYENREAMNVAQGLTVTPNPTVDRLLMSDRGGWS